MSGREAILERIVARRRLRLAERQADTPLEAIREQALRHQVRGGFAAALRKASPPIAVIAELKKASPSEGQIRDAFSPEDLARDLAAAGAVALSVVTEPDYFHGDDGFLAAARKGAPEHPLLRKDFLLDPWQVWESRLLGADAVLLIAGLLPSEHLKAMLESVKEVGLEAVVEAKSEAEIHSAVEAGAPVIGLNARNLDDFSVDLGRVEALASQLPAEILGVAESGITGAEDLARLSRAGFKAALVGTALMRAVDPGACLSDWLARAVASREVR